MDGAGDNATEILDVRGLNCPLPVLKARKALLAMAPGGRLQVEATDPLAAIDLPAFCSQEGHVLVSVEAADGFQRYVIQRR